MATTTLPGTTTLLERRLAAEWALLQQLADRNPGRLTGLHASDGVFHLHLHGPAALPANPPPGDPYVDVHPVEVHAIRIDFPVHFPAVPMELFLETPIFHPNIHPETGFVCLWERHRVSNTVEHALHKTVAMLAGDLLNPHPMHVMQPLAMERPVRARAMPLLGVEYDPLPVAAGPSRRRLQ